MDAMRSVLGSPVGWARVLALSSGVGLLLVPAAETQERWITPQDIELTCRALHFNTDSVDVGLRSLCASTLPRFSAWTGDLPTLRSVLRFAAVGDTMASLGPRDPLCQRT